MSKEMHKTDELQPLGEDQAKQVREFVDKLEKERPDYFETLQVGQEQVAELRITPEACILYADGVEDYNPWYEDWPIEGSGKSPFGPAIAPPLLLSRWCGEATFTRRPGIQAGVMHASHDSHIIKPVLMGTLVRFRGKVTRKFIKRGRRYYQREIKVENAETGELLFEETREVLASYKKVSE